MESPMSDPTTRSEPSATPVCADLRSKKWFFLEAPPRSAADLLDGSCALWCDRTGLALGPHNAVVDAELCTPERRCFRSRPSTIV